VNRSDDILLAKWLSGELTESELNALRAEYDLETLESILKRQEQYVPVTMSSDELWDGFKSKQTKSSREPTEKVSTSKTKTVRRFILLILALLAAKVIYGLLFDIKKPITINTQYAAKSAVNFLDGSFAKVGPKSTLQYSEDSWAESREIRLSGQAYFSVEKGAPFIVSTSAGSVEVLGTQFDVWSIDAEHMRITCSEGRVRVKNNGTASDEISAGEQIYISNGVIKKAIVDKGSMGDWQDNFRNYQTTPVRILLADMERFYKTSFSVDKSIENDLFSGVLPTDDLDKCVRFLEASLSYETDRKENTIHFSK